MRIIQTENSFPDSTFTYTQAAAGTHAVTREDNEKRATSCYDDLM